MEEYYKDYKIYNVGDVSTEKILTILRDHIYEYLRENIKSNPSMKIKIELSEYLYNEIKNKNFLKESQYGPSLENNVEIVLVNDIYGQIIISPADRTKVNGVISDKALLFGLGDGDESNSLFYTNFYVSDRKNIIGE